MERPIPLITIRFPKSLFIFFLFLVFVFLAAEPKSEVLEEIDILTGEWKPYTSKDLEGYGLASEIVTRVLKRMGYRPNYIFIPFDQAYELAYQSEKNDGVRGTFPFWKLPFVDRKKNVRDRTDEMYFSQPLTKRMTTLVIFYNPELDKEKKINDAKTISDLSDYKIVVVKGYAYPEVFTDILKDEKRVEHVESEVEAFSKLFDMDIPRLVLAEERVGNQILNERWPNKEIQITNKDLFKYEEEIYFIASRRNPNNQKFIKKFNKNLKILMDQGVINDLETEYFRGPLIRLSVHPKSLVSPVGKKNLKDNFEIKLPRGTRAAVIRWGGEFDTDNKDFYNFTLVEIMNGPLKGKKLFIENKFIEMP